MKRVAVCFSVLQCVAVCCRVLQCVAVCCSVSLNQDEASQSRSVLWCVAVCCSVLQSFAGASIKNEWRSPALASPGVCVCMFVFVCMIVCVLVSEPW